MNEFDFSQIQSDAINNCLQNMPNLDYGKSDYETAHFNIFIYFSRISSKLAPISRCLDVLRLFQICAAINTYYLVSYLVLERENPLIVRFLYVFLEFDLPSDLQTPNFIYVVIIQFCSLLCIVIYFLLMGLVMSKRHVPQWFCVIGYIFIMEIPSILLFPNCILTSRAITLFIGEESSDEVLFVVVEIIIALFIFLLYNISIYYKSSLFCERSITANNYRVTSPHSLIVFLCLLGWGTFSYETLKQSLTFISFLTIAIAVAYVFNIRVRPYCLRMYNSLECAYAAMLLFVGCSSYYFYSERSFTNHSLFIYISFFVGLVAYILYSIFCYMKDRKFKKILDGATCVADLEIKNDSDFIIFVKNAIEMKHPLIYEGHLIKYAIDNIVDARVRFIFLRYLLLIPSSTTYVKDYEELLKKQNIISYNSTFHFFEYFTIKSWRAQLMDYQFKEKLRNSAKIIHSFYQLAALYSSYLSQESRESSFILGQYLAKMEDRLEFHVEQWVLCHPTNLSVLRFAADFYDTAALDKTYAHELKILAQTYKVYDAEMPRFREIMYLFNSPISFTRQQQMEVQQQQIQRKLSNDEIDPKMYHITPRRLFPNSSSRMKPIKQSQGSSGIEQTQRSSNDTPPPEVLESIPEIDSEGQPPATTQGDSRSSNSPSSSQPDFEITPPSSEILSSQGTSNNSTNSSVNIVEGENNVIHSAHSSFTTGQHRFQHNPHLNIHRVSPNPSRLIIVPPMNQYADPKSTTSYGLSSWQKGFFSTRTSKTSSTTSKGSRVTSRNTTTQSNSFFTQGSRAWTFSVDDIFSDELFHERIIVTDLYSFETKKYIKFIYIYLVIFLIALFVYGGLLFSNYFVATKHTTAVVSMIGIYREYTSTMSILMVLGIIPAKNKSLTIPEKSLICDFIRDYQRRVNNFHIQVYDIMLQSSILNETHYMYYYREAVTSETITGSPVTYSYKNLAIKLGLLTFEVFPSPEVYYIDSPEYSLLIKMLANMTLWSHEWYSFNMNAKTSHIDKITNKIFKTEIIISLYLICFAVYIIILPFILHAKMNQLKGVSRSTKISEGFKMILRSIEEKYTSEGSLIFQIIVMIILIIAIAIGTLLYQNYTIHQALDIITSGVDSLIRDIHKIMILASGVTNVELLYLNHDHIVDDQLLMQSLLQIQQDLYAGLFTLDPYYHPENHAMNIALGIISQLCGEALCYNAEENRQMIQKLIIDLIPTARNDSINIYNESQTKAHHYFIQISEIQILMMLVLYLLFSALCFKFALYGKSLVYVEYIVKMLPYIKSKMGEKICDNMQTQFDENNMILDLTGVPSVIIDDEDKIVYANHLWLSLFKDSQAAFIGEDYHKFAHNDEDGEIYAKEGLLRIFMINRTSKIQELRSGIHKIQETYDIIINSTQPTKVLTEKQLNTEVICLTLSIIPSDTFLVSDIDIVRFYINEILVRLSVALEEFDGSQLFLNSCYDICIYFGLNGGDLKLHALCAMELAAKAIRFTIEEGIFDCLSIAAVMMAGKVGGEFDGKACRMHRDLNSISLSPFVADLLREYIYDTAGEFSDDGVVQVDFRLLYDQDYEQYEYYEDYQY